MKITREIIENNFTEKDSNEIICLIKKYNQTIKYYQEHEPELMNQYYSLMNQNELNLIQYGELSDELIQFNLENGTNNDKEFKTKNGTKVPDIWQTTFKIMLLKIVTELDTIVDLNRYEIFNIQYNPNATSIKTAKDRPIAEPDFIMNISRVQRGEEKTYFLELKSYVDKDLDKVKDTLYFKEWQYFNFKRHIYNGEDILVLHKYYLKDGRVLYRFFNLRESFINNHFWWETDIKIKDTETYYHMVYTHLKPFKEFYQDLSTGDGYVKTPKGTDISLNKIKRDTLAFDIWCGKFPNCEVEI